MSDVATAAPEKARPVPPAPPKEEEKKVKVLKASRFGVLEFTYARFSATLPAGWTVEDALQPEFWAQVSHNLERIPVTGEREKSGSIIELRSEDHSFYAELYVRAVAKHGLIVQLLGKPHFLGREARKTDGYEIRWNIGKHGWDIIRNSDRFVIGDGKNFPTREAAEDWLKDMLE